MSLANHSNKLKTYCTPAHTKMDQNSQIRIKVAYGEPG